VKEETLAWLGKADEHLKSAKALFDLEHHAQCIFFCQQATEVLLKAMWIEQAEEGLPRRTHDLVALAAELDLDLSEEQTEFLRRLSEQYMSTRYPDILVEYSEEDAVEYLDKTEELFAWLRQRLS
jgi:HEPN domain-containing protein